MKSIFIKTNKLLPILTDTLPYEVPFMFSNRGFYKSLKNDYDEYFNEEQKKISNGLSGIEESSKIKNLYDFFINIYFNKENLNPLKEKIRHEITIPYVYEIIKNETGYRTISLVHPLLQIKTCDFYEEYKELILSCCCKSSLSLRYPSKTSSRVLKKHSNLINKIVNDDDKKANTSDLKETVIEDHQNISLSDIPKTYFVYEKYNMLYDFYESSEYVDLEKKYSICHRFDLRACFDSIYTHTIEWAVKDKKYAKEIKNNSSFEAVFDKIMQNSNYGETNGIPIGGEVSRIFAEIILQDIDLNIEKVLNEKDFNGKKILKSDYKIKRYIDDFFVFTNDEKLSLHIQRICEKELKKFKLFINEQKTYFIKRPFATNITSAKNQTSKIIYEHLSSYHEKNYCELFDEELCDKETKRQENKFTKSIYHKKASYLINLIRCIVYDHKITFYEIANLCLGIIKKDLLKTLSYIQEIEGDKLEEKKYKIQNYLKNMIFIAFYVFYCSPRSHTCSSIFKISYVIIEISKKLKDTIFLENIKQEIFIQSAIFCEKLEGDSFENIVEFLDVILLIGQLGCNYKLKEERLERIFKNLKTKSASYFELIVLLSYIKKDKEYEKIKKSILSNIEEHFSKNNLKNTETFLIFFDVINCPYLEPRPKKDLLNKIGLNRNHEDIINFIESKKWFFDWNMEESLDLKTVLEMKEFSINY